MGVLGRVAVFVALTLIDSYRLFISPLLGKNCRFEPTCSVYAAQVIRDHGILTGGRLAVWRLLRCHPLSKGGIDLPPPPHRH